ncbi:hypothetical protein N7478_003952 [Penicillium angulare]|uniref:uncharacterized protein n=1 Tax=Penicillium angulare TaxID=116970 RepID=UPI00254066F3|nr:uncharacterized protein N7478_003952 [Penicillium angulare]KAJ5278580.1 hypothetical protein N7478_003952 [Penicillium angulare]
MNHTESPAVSEKDKNALSTTSNDPQKIHSPRKMEKIVQEGIILAGGAVAILLQVAEPGVAKGVDEHSNFAYRPMDRLRTTMTYVYCMVYGTEKEKMIVIDMVHRAHNSVSGPDYSADDPKLQLWVAATLYAVAIDIYERTFGPINEDQSEQIYREYSVLAESLRVPPDLWPTSRQEFWKYWDHQIATMEITQHAKNVAQDLLRNRKVPLFIRALLPMIRLTSTEMLPIRLRDAYELRSSKTRNRTHRFLMAITRTTYPHLPERLRTYPMRYYLKDMRRRLRDAI